jgi:uncharacterized metal-binding protein
MTDLKKLMENRLHYMRIATAFCVDQEDEEAEIAHRLHQQGVLELVRSRLLTTNKLSFNYKLYRIK